MQGDRTAKGHRLTFRAYCRISPYLSFQTHIQLFATEKPYDVKQQGKVKLVAKAKSQTIPMNDLNTLSFHSSDISTNPTIHRFQRATSFTIIPQNRYTFSPTHKLQIRQPQSIPSIRLPSIGSTNTPCLLKRLIINIQDGQIDSPLILPQRKQRLQQPPRQADTYTKRSSISTSLTKNSNFFGDKFRNSRIANLPNPKKINLKQNPPFITIFQAIQIIRLSHEIEVLRIKATEFEQLHFNFNNCNVQIKELTDYIKGLQRENNELKHEREQSNIKLQNVFRQNDILKNQVEMIEQKYEAECTRNKGLENEADKWKNRCKAQRECKVKQIQDLRTMMQNQRKSVVDREVRELTIRFSSQQAQLQSQNRKNQQKIDKLEHYIEQLKQKCQRYQVQVIELRNNRNVEMNYEKKINTLNHEVMKLGLILNEKEEEIHNNRQREYKLQRQLEQQKEWEYQFVQSKRNYEALIKQAEQWKLRASKLQQEVLKGQYLKDENQKLSSQLQSSQGEVKRLQTITSQYCNQNQSLKRLLNEKNLELCRYKHIQSEIKSYKQSISQSETENNRINSILKSRMAEIEKWKDQNHKLEAALSSKSQLEIDKNTADLRLNIAKKKNQDLESQISQLQNTISKYKKQQANLNHVKSQNACLTTEIEKMNNNLKNQAEDLNDFKVKYSKMESTLKEYKNFEEKVKDYQHKIALQTIETEKLKDLLKDRNIEITQLEEQHIEFHQKITHYQNYDIIIGEKDQIINQNNETITSLKQNIENQQLKMREATNEIKQLEMKLRRAYQEWQQEINMLNMKISQKDEELQEGRIFNLESQKKRKYDLIQRSKQHQNQLVAYRTELQSYKRRLQIMETHETQRKLTRTSSSKHINLNAEMEKSTHEPLYLGKSNCSQSGYTKENLRTPPLPPKYKQTDRHYSPHWMSQEREKNSKRVHMTIETKTLRERQEQTTETHQEIRQNIEKQQHIRKL